MKNVIAVAMLGWIGLMWLGCESTPSGNNTPPPEGSAEVGFELLAFDCEDCAVRLEKKLASMSGVVSAQCDASSGKVVIWYDPNATSEDAFQPILEEAGFGVLNKWANQKSNEKSEEMNQKATPEKVKLIAKGTRFNIADNVVSGALTLFDFYSEW